MSIRILKSGSCPSLSGKSKLTYEIACNDDDASDLALRIATNTGGGFFSDEWIPLSAVEKVLHSAAAKKGLSSTTFHGTFKGKSVNTAGFLLAVLKHEGAVRPQEGKSRLYEVAEFDGFVDATRALMRPISARSPKSVKAAAAPAKKAIQKAPPRKS